jgi:hypothetical protein
MLRNFQSRTESKKSTSQCSILRYLPWIRSKSFSGALESCCLHRIKQEHVCYPCMSQSLFAYLWKVNCSTKAHILRLHSLLKQTLSWSKLFTNCPKNKRIRQPKVYGYVTLCWSASLCDMIPPAKVEALEGSLVENAKDSISSHLLSPGLQPQQQM